MSHIKKKYSRVEIRESDELRLKLLGWLGKNQLTFIQAIRLMGVDYHGTSPSWMREQPIPWDWKPRIQDLIEGKHDHLIESVRGAAKVARQAG